MGLLGLRRGFMPANAVFLLACMLIALTATPAAMVPITVRLPPRKLQQDDPCNKCNVPESQGGCRCNDQCECDPCYICNLPKDQGGCRCDDQCNCDPEYLESVVTFSPSSVVLMQPDNTQPITTDSIRNLANQACPAREGSGAGQCLSEGEPNLEVSAWSPGVTPGSTFNQFCNFDMGHCGFYYGTKCTVEFDGSYPTEEIRQAMIELLVKSWEYQYRAPARPDFLAPSGHSCTWYFFDGCKEYDGVFWWTSPKSVGVTRWVYGLAQPAEGGSITMSIRCPSFEQSLCAPGSAMGTAIAGAIISVVSPAAAAILGVVSAVCAG